MTTHVFEFDLSELLGEDGRLSEEGRVTLMARLRDQFRSRFPFVPGDVIDRSIAEIAEGIAGQMPEDIRLKIMAGTARAQCARAVRGLDGAQQGVMSLAHHIDSVKSESGPHVFLCGEASGKIETAVRLLREAGGMIEAMLNCKECFGGDSEAQHEPPN